MKPLLYNLLKQGLFHFIGMVYSNTLNGAFSIAYGQYLTDRLWI